MEGAREALAKLLNCKPAELIFCSGGTEAINLALRGTPEGRSRISAPKTEHHAVLHSSEAMARSGSQIELLDVDGQGRLLDKAPKGGLLSVMHANNETGLVHPVAELADLAHQHGALLHCDAVQSFGKLPLDLKALGADLASFSAHKFGGPKGVGLLFKSEKVRLAPQISGGEQEHHFRAGTENVAGIVGMAAAAEAALRGLEAAASSQALLRDRLQAELLRLIPGLKLNSAEAPRACNTLSVIIPGVESGLMIMRLDQEGISVSAGSACAAGALEPSHVLKAMGVSDAESRCVLRYSLGRPHTEADVLRAASATATAWKDFQKAGI